MTKVRTYKGWEIHKQTVGPMGWNVRGPEVPQFANRHVKTGFKTLAAAREYINFQIEAEALPA